MSEIQRAALERNKENRARLAIVSGRFTAQGEGLAEFDDGVDFALAYLDMPYVMTGVHFDLDEADLAEGTLPPQVTGFVTDWDQNEQGFYTGAYCAAVITWGTDGSSDVVIPDGFELQIDFTFAGMAMKDVDPQVPV